MKEARIILPLVGNYHTTEASEQLHRLFRIRVAKRFGGYTATKGYGGWVDGNGNLIEEGVMVYDIGFPGALTEADAAIADSDLCAMAMSAGRSLKQDAVYVRTLDGEVRIIELD